jgi:hypothetical protein
VTLIEEKIVFQAQNEQLRERGTAFGFEYGNQIFFGCWDLMMKKHLKKKYHVSADTFKQDLLTTLMNVVYLLRRGLLTDDDEVQVKFLFISKKILNVHIILYNGQIVKTVRINPSGHDGTTLNNCLAYLYLIVKVLYRIGGIELVLEAVLSIFGDDWLTSSDVKEICVRSYWDEVWAEQDMRFKWFLGSSCLFDHTFLGSHTVLKTYYGKEYCCRVPDVEKIVNSIVITEKRMTLEQKICRGLSFLLLVVHERKVFDVIRSIVKKWMQKLRPRHSFVILPTWENFLALDLGFEGERVSFFLPDDVVENARSTLFGDSPEVFKGFRE